MSQTDPADQSPPPGGPVNCLRRSQDVSGAALDVLGWDITGHRGCPVRC